MKIATIRSTFETDIKDVPRPKARDEYVVVKIHTAPMCTEYKNYRDGIPEEYLGHEAAGEVVEVDKSSLVRKGDRVVVMPQYPCFNCSLCESGDYIHCENVVDPLKITDSQFGTATYAQYVVKSDKLLIPIPDDLSYQEASMACCGLGASFGAVKSLSIGSTDSVLITGLGPVGLGAVINCLYLGAKVIGVARNKYRAKLAKDLGAHLVLDPNDPELREKVRDVTQSKGIDKAIECSGGNIYQKICIDTVRRKGMVSFVGESGELPIAISDELIRKGLTIMGSWHWNLNDTSQLIETIRQSKPLINKLVTHVFPLEKLEDAFKLQIEGRCGKILLRPWSEDKSGNPDKV